MCEMYLFRFKEAYGTGGYMTLVQFPNLEER